MNLIKQLVTVTTLAAAPLAYAAETPKMVAKTAVAAHVNIPAKAKLSRIARFKAFVKANPIKASLIGLGTLATLVFAVHEGYIAYAKHRIIEEKLPTSRDKEKETTKWESKKLSEDAKKYANLHYWTPARIVRWLQSDRPTIGDTLPLFDQDTQTNQFLTIISPLITDGTFPGYWITRTDESGKQGFISLDVAMTTIKEQDIH